ncbi:E3 ubiquitin-protein ligase RFWD3-like [Scaptodrosophila lebanonensis]|uniref:E3 ubiquitin-protein ligase RFWD3-like n=1 Tax=Drosophila lebanonensis TaxID=7225 RepID=A0A6J2T2D8_DROLE|nr:E3 ubiquitin-protein ligase RFWD3-like [Scaptodrosophila lebanonensis]
MNEERDLAPEPPVADQPVEVAVVVVANIGGPPTSEGAQEPATASEPADMEEGEPADLDAPPPSKKRKRSNSDEDDGMTCPICFDSWEVSGEHRLVSLRCGHLFGESCLRRCLTQRRRRPAVKMCPVCKTKATTRDIRHIYARSLQAIDRSEVHRLRSELAAERRRTEHLLTNLNDEKMAHIQTLKKFRSLVRENEQLRACLSGGGLGEAAASLSGPLDHDPGHPAG